MFGPDGNLVAPPQLTTDGPVAFFAQPIEIALGIALGQDFNLASSDSVHRALSQLFHPHKPLVG